MFLDEDAVEFPAIEQPGKRVMRGKLAQRIHCVAQFQRVTQRPFKRLGVDLALYQIIECASLHRLDVDVLARFRRQKNNRHMATCRDGLADKREPVAFAQLVIEQAGGVFAAQ
jgi:hypothetical protein